jgi:hypothetical protein
VDAKGEIIDFSKTINTVDEGAMFGDDNGDASSRKFGFINKSGDVVIKPQFDYAEEFKEGMAPVKGNGDL